MTQIYLVRHAEAEGNLYRRVHGWYDSLITDNGYRQIAALAHRFESVQIDAVYSSDLFRTRTTAGAIYRQKGLELHTRRSLREVNMGVWEDKPWGVLARIDPEQLGWFNATDPRWGVEGGETHRQLRQRLGTALRKLAKDHPGQTIAVVSHGMAIRAALSELQGFTMEQMAAFPHSDNTAVSLVELEGDRVNVVFANDSSHLPEEISTFARQRWWKQDAGDLADANLWYRPLDMEMDADIYCNARREAWLSIHGSMDLYDEEAFYQDAKAQWRCEPRAVTCAMLGDRVVGLIQLDTRRDGEKGIGYIPFVYMMPEFRKKGHGVQLIGEAISVYRPLGRRYLRLRCAPDNAVAQRFYARFGFRRVGAAEGSRVPLDLLEKYIGYGE